MKAGPGAPFELDRGSHRLRVRLVDGALAQLDVRAVWADPQEHVLARLRILPNGNAVSCANGAEAWIILHTVALLATRRKLLWPDGEHAASYVQRHTIRQHKSPILVCVQGSAICWYTGAWPHLKRRLRRTVTVTSRGVAHVTSDTQRARVAACRVVAAPDEAAGVRQLQTQPAATGWTQARVRPIHLRPMIITPVTRRHLQHRPGEADGWQEGLKRTLPAVASCEVKYVVVLDVACAEAAWSRESLDSGVRSNLGREELCFEQAVEHVDDVPDADAGRALRRRVQRAPEVAADPPPVGSAAWGRQCTRVSTHKRTCDKAVVQSQNSSRNLPESAQSSGCIRV